MTLDRKECVYIRCQEVRDREFDLQKVRLEVSAYHTANSTENLISFSSAVGWLLRICCLPLPKDDSPPTGIDETEGTPPIRALNVFGPAKSLRSRRDSGVQHNGFGTRMLAEAERLAKKAGFNRVAMNSAVGVRRCSLGRGYYRGETLLLKSLE